MRMSSSDTRRVGFLSRNLNSIKWTFEHGWMVRHNGDDFTSHRGLRMAIDKAMRHGKKKVKRSKTTKQAELNPCQERDAYDV